MEERRRYKRSPVIHEMDETIQIGLGTDAIPGLLVDLSAGGMSLLTYSALPLSTLINLSIDLPGLKTHHLMGKVVWTVPKGEMWRVGITFSKIDPADFRHINRLAFDFSDCETKLALGVSDVCFEKCSYLKLCHKPQKLHNNKR
ncbi:MAG: PilZ domain-containing protein [Elusimicrobiota bacterium]